CLPPVFFPAHAPHPSSAPFPYTTLVRSLFKGRMKDFRLYDRALTAQEVADLASAAAQEAVAADAAALDLGDTSAVVTDLALPARSEEHTSELQSREQLVCRRPPEKTAAG